MQVLPVTSLDMKEVHEWWTKQGWPPIPHHMLPETGWIIPGVCAGWLYQANSSVCKLEWIVANPDASNKAEGLDTLIQYITQQATHYGYKVMFTETKHAKLIERLQQHGYEVGDTGITHLFKHL